MVLSFVITPLFKAIAIQSQQKEAVQEEAGNERALAALALFFRQNGRYPCPANITFAPGDANFGAEAGGCAGAGIAIGGLPVNTLNLPFETAANVHGWKHIYAVTRDLAATGTYDGQGSITINNSGGALLNQHFVIVNPGADGKGTNALYGAAGFACGAAADSENCDNDTTFADLATSLPGNSTNANHYDDTISYTLAREQSTFWVASENAGTGGLNIVNRNTGNIGIGIAAPTSKMHISGGNVRVQGGDVNVDQNVDAGQNITAGNEINAGTAVRSPNFRYCTPGVAPCP